MSLSDAWDRFFWSLIIIVLVGLLWMKFLQPYAACEGPGLIVSLIIGGIYFYIGYRKATRPAPQSRETSEQQKESA